MARSERFELPTFWSVVPNAAVQGVLILSLESELKGLRLRHDAGPSYPVHTVPPLWLPKWLPASVTASPEGSGANFYTHGEHFLIEG